MISKQEIREILYCGGMRLHIKTVYKTLTVEGIADCEGFKAVEGFKCRAKFAHGTRLIIPLEDYGLFWTADFLTEDDKKKLEEERKQKEEMDLQRYKNFVKKQKNAKRKFGTIGKDRRS